MNQVYVIDFGDRIKVGRTTNIEQRLKTIETAGGHKAKRVFNVPADGIYETLMHEQLDRYRTVGEFFTYSYDDAVALLQRLIAENMAEKARLEKEAARLEKERIRLEEQKTRQQEAAEKKRVRRTDATARQEEQIVVTPQNEARPQNEDVKFINLRLRETEFKDVAKLAIDAGITKAAFAKMATLYIADLEKAGALTIGGGAIIDHRDRRG